MEDSFRVRIEKAFGSLTSSTSTQSSFSSTTNFVTSSSLNSLWCLTDDELQRDEWIRNKTDRLDPFPLDKFETRDIRSEMERDLEKLEVDDDKEEVEEEETRESRAEEPDGFSDEEWDIKNSIGRDCTLDFEEEEDANDKVAVGKENAVRLYMSEVTDYVINTDDYNELPSSFEEVIRDPRANNIAAKLRLKEDAEAAKKMNSLHVTEKDSVNGVGPPCSTVENDNPKSILKRKDEMDAGKSHQEKLDFKSQKRVRFDPGCKDDLDEERVEAKEIWMETDAMEETLAFPLPLDYPSGVPDYMRNPTMYTRYTLESSDVDDKSNRQAYMDFLNMLKKPNATDNQPDATDDLSKSVTFIPKRKSNANNGKESKQDQDEAGQDSMPRRDISVGIAAIESVQNEASAMEEDDLDATPIRRINSLRSVRQYRTKASLEIDD